MLNRDWMGKSTLLVFLVLAVFLASLIASMPVEAKKWYEYIPGLAKLLGKDKKDNPAPPPPQPTCKDSDSQDYYSKGYLTYTSNPFGLTTESDSCKDNQTLVERICNSQTNSTGNSKEYTCPYGCLEGSCDVPAAIKISDIPAQSWDEDTTHSINLKDYFSVPDGVSLTFTAATVQNIRFSVDSQGVITFTPDKDFSGGRQIGISASSRVGSKSKGGGAGLVDLTVNPVNDPPKVTQHISKIFIGEKTLWYKINLSAYFTDIDSPTITFFANTSDPGLGVEIEDGNKAKIFKNSPDFYGEVDVVFTASDGSLTTPDIAKIIVAKPAVPVASNAPAPQPTPQQTPQANQSPNPTPSPSSVQTPQPSPSIAQNQPNLSAQQPTPSQPVVPTPQKRACTTTDFDFKWSECSGGWQSGVYTKKTGSDCNGLAPDGARQVCVYAPPEKAKLVCTDTSYVITSSETCQSNGKKIETYTKTGNCEGVQTKTKEVSCTYVKICDQNDWQLTEWNLSCNTNCEYSRSWTKLGSCSGTLGKPSDETRLHKIAIRKNGYYLQSLEITDQTSAIPMGNAVLIPGGKSGEVLVDYMELVVKDEIGKETVIAEDNFDSTDTVPFGGSWTIDPWFGIELRGQDIFHIQNGNLVAPVNLYPNEVLHPWGTQYPRIKIPEGSKTIEMRTRIKATDDASWQWGLDFYKSSTADKDPMAEGGISDWYFAEHGWVNVTVGPVILIIPKCNSNDWTSSPTPCVNGFQTRTYSKNNGANCEGQKPADEVISCNMPPVLKQNIPNQVWDEDANDIINLNQYFSDVEGLKRFSASTVNNIKIEVMGGIAALIPDKDFYGTRTVTFTITDLDGASVNSNQVTLTINPKPDIDGSIITPDSTISTDSSIILSTSKSSIVKSSGILNSNIINSSILNSNISDSFVDPSTVTRSTVTASDIIDSTITDSTVTKSAIKNMAVQSAVVIDNVLQSGKIVFNGKTYTGWRTLASILNSRQCANDDWEPVFSPSTCSSEWGVQTKTYAKKPGVECDGTTGKHPDETVKCQYWIGSSDIEISGSKLTIKHVDRIITYTTDKAGNLLGAPSKLPDWPTRKYYMTGHFDGWTKTKQIPLVGNSLVVDFFGMPDAVYAFSLVSLDNSDPNKYSWLGIETSYRDDYTFMGDDVWQNQEMARVDASYGGKKGHFIVIEKQGDRLVKFLGNTIPKKYIVLNPDQPPPGDLQLFAATEIKGDNIVVKWVDRILVADIKATSIEECDKKTYSVKQGVRFEQGQGRPRIVGTFNNWKTDKAIIGSQEGDKFIFNITDFALPDGTYTFGFKYAEDGTVPCNGQWLYVGGVFSDAVKFVNEGFHVVVKIKDKKPYFVSEANPTIREDDVSSYMSFDSAIVPPTISYHIGRSNIEISGLEMKIKYADKILAYPIDKQGNSLGSPSKLSDWPTRKYYMTGHFDGWTKTKQVSLSGTNLIADFNGMPDGVYAFSVVTEGTNPDRDDWLGIDTSYRDDYTFMGDDVWQNQEMTRVDASYGGKKGHFIVIEKRGLSLIRFSGNTISKKLLILPPSTPTPSPLPTIQPLSGGSGSGQQTAPPQPIYRTLYVPSFYGVAAKRFTARIPWDGEVFFLGARNDAGLFDKQLAVLQGEQVFPFDLDEYYNRGLPSDLNTIAQQLVSGYFNRDKLEFCGCLYQTITLGGKTYYWTISGKIPYPEGTLYDNNWNVIGPATRGSDNNQNIKNILTALGYPYPTTHGEARIITYNKLAKETGINLNMNSLNTYLPDFNSYGIKTESSKRIDTAEFKAIYENAERNGLLPESGKGAFFMAQEEIIGPGNLAVDCNPLYVFNTCSSSSTTQPLPSPTPPINQPTQSPDPVNFPSHQTVNLNGFKVGTETADKYTQLVSVYNDNSNPESWKNYVPTANEVDTGSYKKVDFENKQTSSKGKIYQFDKSKSSIAVSGIKPSKPDTEIENKLVDISNVVLSDQVKGVKDNGVWEWFKEKTKETWSVAKDSIKNTAQTFVGDFKHLPLVSCFYTDDESYIADIGMNAMCSVAPIVELVPDAVDTIRCATKKDKSSWDNVLCKLTYITSSSDAVFYGGVVLAIVQPGTLPISGPVAAAAKIVDIGTSTLKATLKSLKAIGKITSEIEKYLEIFTKNSDNVKQLAKTIYKLKDMYNLHEITEMLVRMMSRIGSTDAVVNILKVIEKIPTEASNIVKTILDSSGIKFAKDNAYILARGGDVGAEFNPVTKTLIYADWTEPKHFAHELQHVYQSLMREFSILHPSNWDIDFLAKKLGKSASEIKQMLSNLVKEEMQTLLLYIDESDAYEFIIKYKKELELTQEEIEFYSSGVDAYIGMIEGMLGI